MSTQQIIGIDLGTTLSAAAIFMNDEVKMIPINADDKNYKEVLMPSMVAFNDNQILVGEEVKYQMVTNAENSIYQIKRILGRNFDDKSVQQNSKIWPFKIIKSDENNQCKVKVRFNKKEKLFSPEEISSQIIQKLKHSSEKYLGHFIHDAVISVPAYFNNNQKAATRNAGLIAGLNVKHIINEPTAAALAYGFGRDENDTTTKNVLVFDLGGGTFDISILRIEGRQFNVLAINGDNHLGGEDFTNRMVNHLFREFESSQKSSVELSHQMRHRLREACENAKIKLSNEGCLSVDIELDNFYNQNDLKVIDFYTSFTRETFESINNDLFSMTIELTDKCLKDAELNSTEIDEVLLVGGSTRILKIRQLMREKFIHQKVNTSINPDEAVGLGAAIEAALLSGECSAVLKNTKLIDITPSTLGVRVGYDDRMYKFIHKNTSLPHKCTDVVFTLHNNQQSIVFPIFEGENYYTKHNTYLGEFTIYSIPQGPAGSVKFDVTFDLDKNGILNVTAVERQTKKSGSIRITQNFARLSDCQIEHLSLQQKEMIEQSKSDRSKAEKKRRLERYSYDVYQILQNQDVQEKISSRVEKKCRAKNEIVRQFLSNCEDADESEFEANLMELKSICNNTALNDLFKEVENRNLGDLSF